jgi:DNA-directed RNA polymerase I subunit RPA43
VRLDVWVTLFLKVGKVKLCSPDHIALLVHNVFNAAIYRHHIPTDHWEFEYGPADNDPEFSSEVVAAAAAVPAASDGDVEMAESSNRTGQTDAAAEPSMEASTAGGKWVHKLTSEPIGDSEGYLEFVVIG